MGGNTNDGSRLAPKTSSCLEAANQPKHPRQALLLSSKEPSPHRESPLGFSPVRDPLPVVEGHF